MILCFCDKNQQNKNCQLSSSSFINCIQGAQLSLHSVLLSTLSLSQKIVSVCDQTTGEKTNQKSGSQEVKKKKSFELLKYECFSLFQTMLRTMAADTICMINLESAKPSWLSVQMTTEVNGLKPTSILFLSLSFFFSFL